MLLAVVGRVVTSSQGNLQGRVQRCCIQSFDLAEQSEEISSKLFN